MSTATPGLTRVPSGTSRSALAALLLPVKPLTPHCSVTQAGEHFLDPANTALLSLPIVDAGRVLGCITRHELMLRVYMQPYGRELHGRRAVTTIMDARPLTLSLNTTIEAAGQLIGQNLRRPITEDFVLLDDTGRYAGMGIVLDVLNALETKVSHNTQELEQAYRRLKASQHRLVQSEKLATLGQLVAGLAHEINTPLGYVQNNLGMTRDLLTPALSMLQAGAQVLDAALAGDAEELDQGLQRLADARNDCDPDQFADLIALLDDSLHGVAQIGDLVGNLKDFSRVDSAHSEGVDLHGLIDSALRIGGHLLKKRNVQVQCRYGEVPSLRCAPAQINQVLLNLIGNAAQAIEHDQGLLSIRTQSLGGYAMVAVQDNGRGIAAEVLPRIFEPFFTTKPVGQGTGLGLSICQQIVQAHGGRIAATSTPGVGTRFVVALPIARDTAVAR
ncbi:CBS domain protein [Tahibacter aquaticus]|uniref:histidine kinase n=1 Tax=Tahibacter aquaticus TaxID=520092 RepID=A0A4R6YMV1_9GAMM|nr:ATP-binding protein [Tahibacter aquaticus]TDR38875.1 CBS domain protein [Tahibacter aquaticus]